MKQLPNYGDVRTLAYCAFCGGHPNTKDHCPSKVFLDEPLPTNVFAVGACHGCNNGFSADEEYVAVLIECVISGSCEPQLIKRAKIRRILEAKPGLRARIDQSKSSSNGQVSFMPEWGRVRNVITKLAKGHGLYELHELCVDEPYYFFCSPLTLMTEEQLDSFERPEASTLWPEVGSRAMQRLFNGDDISPDGWIVVQEGRYRYNASVAQGRDIRIVIGDYLAARVCWE